jgi:hypothetical protein
MQKLNSQNEMNEEDEKSGIFESLFRKIIGDGNKAEEPEKLNLEKERQEIKTEARRSRVDLSLNKLSDKELDGVPLGAKESKTKRSEKISAETRKMARSFNLLKKGFLFLKGSEFREETSKLDKVSCAKMVFNEINQIRQQEFLEVWDNSEGVLETIKNYTLWLGTKVFKQTNAGKEIFGTVDKYGGLYSTVKNSAEVAVESGKETIRTVKQIEADNKAAAVLAKSAPKEIGKFLRTPNKSERIIEFLQKSTQNLSFKKLVADGKVRGLSLSKKVGAGGIIILAAEKLTELITTGEIAIDEEKNFFENWIFDGPEFMEKFNNLRSSVKEEGVLNSKLAATEFAFEGVNLFFTVEILFFLGSALFASAPLTLGMSFVSAIWLLLRRGSLTALKEIIPKIGLFFTEKFGKKGITGMLKKAVESEGAKKIGKSVAIQTGVQLAISQGIKFVNTTLVSAAKKTAKIVARKVIPKDAKFLLKTVAGVEF